MPINPDALLNHEFADIQHEYVERDAILYALGIGLGADPLDPQQLAFLLETRLQLLPTFAVTLSSPGMWIRDPGFGIDFTKIVHIGQSAAFTNPLPARGTVRGRAQVVSLTDRGEGRGALLAVERTISDAANGKSYCTLRQELLLRGDGGFGGDVARKDEAAAPPDRPPDLRVSFNVSPRAALIYRLSGDWNPLHADPDIATKAGFERPILHGYATYGLAGWVLIRALGGGDPHVLASLSARFTGVVTPGDRIDFAIWRETRQAFFEAKVGEKLVLQRGFATLNAA